MSMSVLINRPVFYIVLGNHGPAGRPDTQVTLAMQSC